MSATLQNDYLDKFRGAFTNMLRWEQFDRLWEKLRSSSQRWYIYQLDQPPPQQACTEKEWRDFLDQSATRLRNDHGEDYCGIVYVDKPEQPSFIKIYDPHNLGVVCGISDAPPPLPGWVLSVDKPTVITRDIFAIPKRKPWWKFFWKSK